MCATCGRFRDLCAKCVRLGSGVATRWKWQCVPRAHLRFVVCALQLACQCQVLDAYPHRLIAPRYYYYCWHKQQASNLFPSTFHKTTARTFPRWCVLGSTLFEQTKQSHLQKANLALTVTPYRLVGRWASNLYTYFDEIGIWIKLGGLPTRVDDG